VGDGHAGKVSQTAIEAKDVRRAESCVAALPLWNDMPLEPINNESK